MSGIRHIILSTWALLLLGCGAMGTEIGNGLKGDRKIESEKAKRGDAAREEPSDTVQTDMPMPTANDKAPETTESSSAEPPSAGVPADSAAGKSESVPVVDEATQLFNLLTVPCVSPWSEALAKAPQLGRVGGIGMDVTATFEANNAIKLAASTGQTRTLSRQPGAELKPIIVVGDDRYRDYAAANYTCGKVTTDTSVTGLSRRTMTITEPTGTSRLVWYVEPAIETGKVTLIQVELTLKGGQMAVFLPRQK